MSTKIEELLTHNGKSWADMTYEERHSLFEGDEPKARSMKIQFDERPWAGKTYGEMSSWARHRLANDRPRTYAALKAEWERVNESD